MPRTGQVITNTFRATRGTRSYVNGRLVYSPMKGFWKSATCEEYDCEHHRLGWSLPLDFSPGQPVDELLQAQGAHRWMVDSGRKFTERWDGPVCVYQFEPGQQCFQKHILPVQRDPVMLQISGPDRFKRMDYDEFQDEFNESAHRSNQNQHIR